MFKFLYLLCLLFVLYLAICAGAYLLQRKLIFHPLKGLGLKPADLGIDAEEVRIRVSDAVTLHGWWAPSENASHTLIWFHGNGGNIAYQVEELSDFLPTGANHLLFDYRGYGESTGSPSVAGINEDALAVYDFLVSRGIRGSSIVPYGRSLGSGPAAWLANRREVAGLLLVQPLTSTVEMGQKAFPFLPVSLLLKERIDNVAELKRFEGPLLVIHGDADDIVPFEMGRKLFQEACSTNKSFETLRGGDHNDIGRTHGNQIVDGVKNWLASLPEPSP